MKTALFFFVIVQTLHFISGNPNPNWRIVGGSEAPDGAAPHLVSLRSSNNQHFCAGSIITQRTIVTSAYCVASQSIENITVVAGTNSLETGGTYYQVENIIIHPTYHPGYKFEDVALIILNSDITFTSLIQPIALHSSIIGGDETVTLTGWGKTEESGSLSNRLQTVDLKTITVYECQGAMVQIGWINQAQLCTLTDNEKGACNGDYGGSVTLNNELVGIASWSVPCAQKYPDVHSRISSFAQWIQENSV